MHVDDVYHPRTREFVLSRETIPPTRRPRRLGVGLRRLAVGAVTSALALAGIAGTASTASADEIVGEGLRIPIAGHEDPGIWVGAITAPLGAEGLVFCINGGLPVPENQPIVAVTTANDPDLAYIMAKHQDENTAAARSAIGYLVHVRHDEDMNLRQQFANNASAEIKNQANAYLAEAATNAGPYATGGSIAQTAGTVNGKITGLGVQSRAGTWLAGQSATVTLSGPATFTNGSKTWTGTTGTSPLALDWIATGNGTVSFTYSANAPTRENITILHTPAGYQSVATYAHKPANESGKVEARGELQADVTFQPIATSKVSEAVVDKGEQISDTLNVSVPGGDTWMKVDGTNVPVTFEGSAYYIPADQVGAGTPTIPAGATPVATATITATGPGDYTSPKVNVPGTGMVTWVWKAVKESQPEANRKYIDGDWSDQFGLGAETTSVRAEGKIKTSLSVIDGAGDDVITDSLWVSGLPEDYPNFAGNDFFGADTKELEHTLYWFPGDLQPTDEKLADATVLGTARTPAKNGFYPQVTGPNGDWIVQKDENGFNLPGSYAIVTRHVESDRVAGLTTSATDVSEQLIILNPVPVYVTTEAKSTGEVKEGESATVWDTAIVTGTVPDGATTTFDLYEWPLGSAPVCENPIWTSEPIPTIAGTFESPKHTVDQVTGTLGFVETTRDRNGNILTQGACGEVTETLVTTPTPFDVTTVAKSTEAVVEGKPATVKDTAEVTGYVPEGTTTTFELYQWPTGSAPVCESPIWTSEPVTTVTGRFESATHDVSNVSGTLGFVEVTRNVDGEVVSRGVCGESSETFVPGAKTASAKGLPVTGATVGFAVAGAIVLIAAGGVLLVMRRKSAA